MQKYLISIVLLFALSPCFSQEDKPEKMKYKSTMFGIGNANVYDSYLSPLDYSGISVGIIEEQMEMTKLLDGKIAAQQLFHLDFASTSNLVGSSIQYTGFLDYNYGLYYKFKPLSALTVFAGSQINGMAGFVYNLRNSNNPASAKAHLNLTLSAAASYVFNIKSQPFRVRYQFTSPFAGIMFSPQYGQSYYEMFLGDGNPLVYFSSYHNQIAMRNYLSLEVPFKALTLRFMYVNWIYETRINYIDTRICNGNLMIGFSKEIFVVSGKKEVKGNFRRVFE